MRLYLSRWQNRALEKLDVVPVGISRGTPRFPVRYRYLRLPDLYPDGWMFGIEGDAEFNKAYRKKLDRIGADRIGAALKGISDEEGGKDLCLLCFEADPARCHRSAFAAWWEERTDQELPELESCGRSRNRDTRTGSSTEEPDCWPTGQDSGRPTQERLFWWRKRRGHEDVHTLRARVFAQAGGNVLPADAVPVAAGVGGR